MEHKRSKRDCTRKRKQKQRDTASEEGKAKEKQSDHSMYLCVGDLHVESPVFLLLMAYHTRAIRTTLRSLPETLQTTALPSLPLLYLVPST